MAAATPGTPEHDTSAMNAVESLLSTMSAQEKAEPGTGDEPEADAAIQDPGTPGTPGAARGAGEEPPADDDKDDRGEWLSHVPEHLRDDARRATLREADYTRKTQELANQRRVLDSQLREVEVLRDQYLQIAKTQGEREKPAPKPSEQPPEGATANEVIEFYVKRAVKAALPDVSKVVDDRLAPLRGDLDTRRTLAAVEDAYVQFVNADGTDPIFQDAEVAKAVGNTLSADEDLRALAQTDPTRAIRLAARAVLGSRKAQLDESRRMAARTTGLRGQPGTTTTTRAKTALEVAAEALARMGKTA